ncbi:MAG: homogentisate 1,2-dioxygenase [Bacteriovoracaceae bacterium]|nr:homogentisate 1,2-dioxygenase [Bacteriovoracaceae bacterium]
MESFKESGIHTKQAHVKIPEGLFEEEHGRKGFFGRVSHLYHTQKPTGWSDIHGELKPECLPTCYSDKGEKNIFLELLFNKDVRISVGVYDKNFSHFFRNADSDEMFFIHAGSGKVETTYGQIEYKKGDYLIIPRGTTYKFFIHSESKILKVESSSEFEQPSRGILGPNALYDQTAIVIPEAALGSEQNLKEYKVEIKRTGQISTVTYPFNPLDVKGWKGSLYPWKISIYDYCPIMSHRYHIPPSGHTMFVCQNFVVCSFVARPLEDTKEEVLKVPFFHSNIDYDEVIFYHEGDFFSRDNMGAGSLTFHPQGIHHGPHPKAFKAANDKTFTNEFAVMVDTRYPLEKTAYFEEIKNKDYWKSWKE